MIDNLYPVLGRVMVIKGAKVNLRHIRIEDLGDLYEYSSQREVAHAAGFSRSQDYLSSLDLFNELDTDLSWIIVQKNGKVVGNICLYELENLSDGEKERHVSLGYALNKNFWNKGYMTDAVNCLINWLVDSYKKIDVVEAYVTLQNVSSQRVLEKAGFDFIALVEVPYFDGYLTRNEVKVYENKIAKRRV